MLDINNIVRDLVLFLLIALTVIFVTCRLAVPYTLGLVIVGLVMSFVGSSALSVLREPTGKTTL